MVSPPFYHFTGEYCGVRNQLSISGRYKQLQGAALDDWQADYTLVVYYNYYSKDAAPQEETEKCVYISFSNGKSSVIDIAATSYRNTAFLAWLTDLIIADLKAKQYTIGTSNQWIMQTAW